MKVKELINILNECNPEAIVIISKTFQLNNIDIDINNKVVNLEPFIFIKK